MYYSQNTKTISLAPASIASNATATLIVDTRGFAEAQFVVLPGTTNTVTNNMSVLKIEEGDTTASFGDLTGYVGGTNAAGGFTIPVNLATSATACQPYVLNVDLRGKKRFLKLSATPKTAVIIGASCNLSRGTESPNSLADTLASQGTDGSHGAASTTLGLAVNPGGAMA